MKEKDDPMVELDYSYNVTMLINKDEINMQDNFIYTDQSSSSESEQEEIEEEAPSQYESEN